MYKYPLCFQQLYNANTDRTFKLYIIFMQVSYKKNLNKPLTAVFVQLFIVSLGGKRV